jgi:dephospho-CoA kinase
MHKIGITGGIGAGKSTVTRIFEILDVPVYNADQRAKALMTHSKPIREQIIRLLGPQAYKADQNLNTEWIARVVFNDRWQLSRLNGIVHPAVEVDYDEWHNGHAGVAYTVKEAALIFDAGSYLTLDATIVVVADEDLRIGRVMKRDLITSEAIKARIEQQWPESRRIQMADFIIDNNGMIPLIPQVLEIHRELTAS